ncbi:hypothetical protein ACIRBZ_37610 [Streptomyces sp. NPDC094038]|uniref:hypothetical protein n=1 Tax=Streptomyces sp. NPDC094038 TaxID=3366055 RepID=UPI003813994D
MGAGGAPDWHGPEQAARPRPGRAPLRRPERPYTSLHVPTRRCPRPHAFLPIELDEFAAVLRGRGAPDHLVQHLLAVAVDYRDGVFAGANDLAKTIGGSDPLDVAGFIAQNRAAFGLQAA